MALPEAREGTVVRCRVGRQDPIRNALHAQSLQLATRAFALAVAVKQDRQHDLGMMRLLALAVDPVRRVKRRQIHLRDRVQQKPREMLLG